MRDFISTNGEHCGPKQDESLAIVFQSVAFLVGFIFIFFAVVALATS